MRVVSTEIPGVLLIEPDVHRDDRGFFVETYRADEYRVGGVPGPFVQDNYSRSVARTLRGLHLQLRRPQGKLIRVVRGAVFDVAVDVRRGSPTFLKWVGLTLSAENFRQCYVPPGIAHGFCALSEMADIEYKCTDVYDPESDVGIAWNDPALAIAWPIADPLLSARDRKHPPVAALLDRLPVFATGPSEL